MKRVRCPLEVKHDEKTRVSSVTMTKQRDMEKPDGVAFAFKLRVVELGTNGRGKQVISCVVDSLDAADAPDRRKKLAGKAKLAMDQLQNAMVDHRRLPDNPKYFPGGGILACPLDIWRTYLFKAGVLEGDKPEAAKKGWQRIRTDLQNAGYIRIWEGLVWIVRHKGTSGT